MIDGIVSMLARYGLIPRGGFRFADPGDVAPGTLLELVGRNGATRRFAKVLRRDGAELVALWCASFLSTSATSDLDAEPGHVRIPGLAPVFDATLFEGNETRIEFAGEVPREAEPGAWLHFVAQGEAVWMLADRVLGNAVYGQAWQQVGSRLSTGDYWARALTIDLEVTRNGSRQVVSGIEPGLAGGGLVDDDRHYASAPVRLAAERTPLCLAEPDRAAIESA